MPKATDPKRVALAPLIDAGFDLIPLNGVSKEPRNKDWTNRNYNPERVTARAAKLGNNVGVRLRSDQLVIDVDPRNGGEQGFDDLCFDLGLDASEWPRVVTGSGGSHYYLAKNPTVTVRNGIAQYPGVEFKSQGRQVVAPGSIHPDTGKPYIHDERSPGFADAPLVPDKLIELIAKPERVETQGGGEHTAEEVGKMLEALDPTEFRDHEKWLSLAMACHHASGGDAREEFLDWSARDPQYAHHRERNELRWESFHAEAPNGVTCATLYKFLVEAGREDAIPRTPAEEDFDDEKFDAPEPEAKQRSLVVNKNAVAPDTYMNAIQSILCSGIEPAWDELKQRVVLNGFDLPWDPAFGSVYSDHVLRLIRAALTKRYERNKFEPSKENVHEAVTTIAYWNRFNPVVLYLDSLKWDGKPRVERLFGDYFNCGHDDYVRAVSRCFMVGAVRRMRSPGHKFDTMPVLLGPQGWNKSTAVRTLFGDEWFSDADLGDLGNKDAAMLLRGIWVQEFAEIDGLRRADVNTLKAFCSRAVDRMRDPFDRVVSDVPRRCVFIGTANEEGYLKDGTGNRRFWPLTLANEINVAPLKRDRGQLWAEAAQMESEGAFDVLPRELWAVAAERQAEQTSVDPWVDQVADYLRERATDEIDPKPDDKVHTAELLESLGLGVRHATKAAAQRLRVVMVNGLGWRARDAIRIGEKIGRGYVRLG
ncbi:MAG TPA: VapE family protein [Xanthobacteraceae bacterium]|nr:VapE family protein [Xanthobacteraceae bacterium]